jgi:hypothetical protein
MIRKSRSLMRLASCFAVIAVVQAMAVQPALACERHDPVVAATHSTATDPVSTHDVDCTDHQAPSPAQHNDDCLANCLTMACSTPAFVAGHSVAISVSREGAPSYLTLQPHPSRSLAPDRPPPRG